MNPYLMVAALTVLGAACVWLQVWLKTGYFFPPKR